MVLLRGSKKVVLRRDGAKCSGIRDAGSGGGSNTPCAAEWFAQYDSDTIGRKRKRSNSGSSECILAQGEVLFIPHGWHYSELLLEECVSVEGVLLHQPASPIGSSNALAGEAVTGTQPGKRKVGLQWGALVSSGEGSGGGSGTFSFF
jgi:hypothetical protein